MTSLSEQKKEARRQLRERAREITASNREALSRAAALWLSEQPAWKNATAILAYLPLSDELDLGTAIALALQDGKKVALPRYVPGENRYCAALLKEWGSGLEPGTFGILEPPVANPCLPLNRLDFVLVPGVAFDSNGFRLGRGKGYYDRLLAEVTGLKCGVARDEQIVPALPVEPHDIRMNFILTPTRWLDLNAAPS